MAERPRFNPDENSMLKQASMNIKDKKQDLSRETKALFGDFMSVILKHGRGETKTSVSCAIPVNGETVATTITYNEELEFIDVNIQSFPYYLHIPQEKGRAALQSHREDHHVQPVDKKPIQESDFEELSNLAKIIDEQLQLKKQTHQSE